jgi:hypothetical protein
MRLLAKIILIILFIPVYLIFLFSINLRFQILKPSFWNNTFSSDGVYTKLSLSIKKNIESQTIFEGGRASDVKIITDLITPENIRDAISKNINNILLFANAKASEIMVYIPVNKIPESLLSLNFNLIKTETNLPDLLKEFNVSGINESQVQLVSHLGFVSWLIFGAACLLIVLIFCLLYISVDFGKRLIAPGVALVLSGIAALAVRGAAVVIQTNWAKDLAGSSNMGDSIIGIVVPPIIQAIFNLWLYFGIAALVMGFLLFFIKKLRYTKSK